MENLIQTGLLGRGLIQIKNKVLVKRYNNCLEDIGLQKTKLKTFHIDGWGWSPEIADEMQNKFYLSHFGTSNPYAIIITPLQEDRPIYFQHHSFDRDLMRIVFHTFRNQIADLTTETGVWIDVDQEVNKYDQPQDLLMIDSITLRFKSTNNLIVAARNQRELVRMFNNDKYAWNDPQLHQMIIDSCIKNGDLRFRSLDIMNIPYTHVRSFYTKAFNNTYVFRDLPGKKPMLIFTNDATAFSGIDKYDHIEYSINDEQLIDKLFEEQLLELDVSIYLKNTDELKRLLLCIIIDEVAQQDAKYKLEDMVEVTKKPLMRILEKFKMNDLYYELDRLIKKLEAGNTVKHIANKPLKLMLAKPQKDLSKMTKLAVEHLKVNISPLDIYKLFEHDKERFYRLYSEWPENKKTWARSFIKEVYQPYYSDEQNSTL